MARLYVKRGLYKDLPTAESAKDGAFYVTTDTAELFVYIDGQMLALSGSGGRSSTSYYETITASGWTEVDGNYEYFLSIPALSCGITNQTPPIISCVENQKEYNYITDAIFEAGSGITFTATQKPTENIDIVIIDSAFGESEISQSISNCFAISDSAADDSDKTATLVNSSIKNSLLTVGTQINILFENANNISEITLNINDTGKFPVYQYSTGGSACTWHEGSILSFVFNGDSWIILNRNIADSEYSGSVQLTDTIDEDLTSDSGYAVSSAALHSVQTSVETIQDSVDEVVAATEETTTWGDFS
jgi:hypothetical protein